MDIKDKDRNEENSRAENNIYVFTDADVEDILLKIDDLYWAFLHLTRKRAFKINFDPQALAKQLKKGPQASHE